MHFTGTVYRNPYWPTWPLLEITQGCTHNRCKFCTMYKDVPFRMSPMEWIEEDLKELAQTDPDATTIQLLSANPLVLPYDKLAPILEMICRYLPKMEYVYLAGRVTDLKNKTVGELKKLKELGMREISLGVESGDDWTLDRIHKGYHASDILEQCHKLEEAGIDYWMTFLNGVAGRSHSKEHAIHSAEIFSQCKPMLVGTGGLTLFPGTLRGEPDLRLRLYHPPHRRREPDGAELPEPEGKDRRRPGPRDPARGYGQNGGVQEEQEDTMKYNGMIYRPPVEADTFLIPVTEGCTHNSCSLWHVL